MIEKFYAAIHRHEYDDKKRDNAFVCHIYLLEGEVSDGRDFGFYKSDRGYYLWVHLATGTWSHKEYKTLGRCKRAVETTKETILYRIYCAEYLRQNHLRFHARVIEDDPGYFERLRIREPGAPAGYAKPARVERYWYQDI
jgi:hypothetical protein